VINHLVASIGRKMCEFNKIISILTFFLYM